jgi:hypothetical protein
MSNIPLITSVRKHRLGVPAVDETVARQFYASPQSIEFLLENLEYVQAPLQGALDLCDYVNKKTTVRNALEIGSFQGELTSIFALKLNPTKLYAVEPFASRSEEDICNRDEAISQHNWEDVKHNFYLRSKQFPNIIHLDKNAFDAAETIANDSLDFVYLGSNNSVTTLRKLIETYLPKLKDGGLMAAGEWGSDLHVKHIVNIIGNVDSYFVDGTWIKKIDRKKIAKTTNKLKPIQNSRIGISIQEQFLGTDDDIKFLSGLESPTKVYLTGFIDFCKYVNTNKAERNFEVKRVVEINCYQGETTTLLAKYLKPEELFVVDQFDKIDESWPKNIALDDVRHNFNIRAAQYPCVKVIDDVDALEAADRFENGSIDLIYISEYASYQYVWRLLAKWLPKISPNGYICGNHWGSANTVQAALDHFGDPDLFFKDSSWLKTKIWDED